MKEKEEKVFDSNFEEEITTWLCDHHNKVSHISRKMIIFKAKKMFLEWKESLALLETFVTH